MVRHNAPTTLFWNCTGIAIVVLSLGMSLSIAQTKTFELELAQYKLSTGEARSKINQVNDRVSKLPISKSSKQQVKADLQAVKEILSDETNK